MAYVGGTPKIILTGDKALALSVLPEGRKFYWRIRNLVESSGVSTYTASNPIGDSGAFVTVGFFDGVSSIEVFHPEVSTARSTPEEEWGKHPVPVDLTYNSGYVRGGVFGRKDEDHFLVGRLFRTAENRAERGKPFFPSGEMSADLAVLPGMGLPQTSLDGNTRYSQYQSVSPSKYSGEMRKVVQAVLGFGRQVGDKVYFSSPEDDPKLPPWALELGFQVRYDYRFARTHGVYTSEDGTKWLVEVGISVGVRVCKLPLLNFTPKAKSDLSLVLDELGYIPSGDVPPNGPAWTTLLPPDGLTPFYGTYSQFTDDWGWAFSDNGGSACITGYRFRSDGHQESALYMLEIEVGEYRGEVRGAAKLVQAKVGYLWAPPAKIGKYLPVKYPLNTPVYGDAVVSHDGAPLRDNVGGPGQKESCDAPIFAAYIDGALHVANFFRAKSSGNPTNSVVWDDRVGESCLLSGSWSWGEEKGPHTSSMGVYTSVHDVRKIMAGSRTESTLTSTDMGYDPPSFGDVITCLRASTVHRARRWRQLTITRKVSGESDGSAIIFPAGDRCAYVFAHAHRRPGGTQVTESMGYSVVGDPWFGYALRCFTGSPPGCTIWPKEVDERACGYNCSYMAGGVKYHPDRRIIGSGYAPSTCSSHADNGDWLTLCTSIDGWNDITRNVPPGYSRTEVVPDIFEGKVIVVSENGESEPRDMGSEEWEYQWLWPSPDPDSGDLQHLPGSSSCLGTPSSRIVDAPRGEVVVIGKNSLDTLFSGVQSSSIGFIK